MRNIRSITSYVLVLLSLSIFVSCSESDNVITPKQQTFLSVTPGKYLSEYTQAEWDVLDEAKSRLNIVTTPDGLRYITELSGSEVNISEELYGKIKIMIENGNNLITGAKESQTRMAGDDCVANCIVELGRRLGSTMNAPLIKQWINNQCEGIGVPESRVLEMVQRWLIAHSIGTPISTAALGDGPIMAVVLGTHAVVVDDIQGSDLRIFDQDLVSTDPAMPHNGYSTVPGAYISSAIQATGVVGGGN